MKIVMRDGREFEGDPEDIVRAMQKIAFGVEHLPLRDYIAWVVVNVVRFEGVTLEVAGSTDRDLAGGLVDEMVRTGLAVRAA